MGTTCVSVFLAHIILCSVNRRGLETLINNAEMMSNPTVQIMILKYHVPLKKTKTKKTGRLREIADSMSEAGNAHLDITEKLSKTKECQERRL